MRERCWDDVLVATPMVSWDSVVERLAAARSYWLSTVATDSAPHVVPVWGAVVDDVWYFYTERRTSKARHLAENPRIAIHLDDADDVLIVHGVVSDLGHPAARPDVVAAFAAKYTRSADLAFLPLADPAFDVLYALHPSRALIWTLDDYQNSQRRWRL